MGLRFQRSVKLMPGVRLNFSASGISTSIGPRGAGINLSSRGNTMHVGIPGTGLSYRSSRAGPGSRSQAARWERQQAREAERLQAEAVHDAHQQVLANLSDILTHRVIEPVDWSTEYAAHPPFEPVAFEVPSGPPTDASASAEVNRANPVFPWIAGIGAAGLAAAVAPQPWLRIPILVVMGVWLVQGVTMLRRRGDAARSLITDQLPAYEKQLQTARAAHAEEQESARIDFQAAEALRARLRAIDVSEDTDLASSVLEVELSNEDIPVPIGFDVHFDGLRRVSLAIEVPDFAEIPETTIAVTKTGKLSERPMAARDRGALYRDMCAGILLRLIHETYRVLPFVHEVSAQGLAQRPIHARNEPRYIALDVTTVRDAFAAYDLDGADPSALFVAMGGQVSSARDGSLKPVADSDE